MEIGSKGIARISIIPMRETHSDKSEMVSQLLFGDHYSVLEISENEKWLKIRMNFDDYEGWIDKNQHHSISEEYFEQINNSDYKISLDLSSTILFNKHQTNIVRGSILPISTNEIFKIEEQLAFNGESKSLSEKRDADFVLQIARKYLNSPYLWGGRSPFGIDCSGFVQIVFRIGGYKLPRDASQQVSFGQDIDIDDAEVGDLAYFKNGEGRIVHVGIIAGEGQIIHASGKVRIDTLDKKGITHKATKALTHQLHSIKRILKT